MLNTALQKAKIELKIWFSQMYYAPFRSISTLLTEIVDVAIFLTQQSNLLIWVLKIVDNAIME